jgi:hypothetical protein
LPPSAIPTSSTAITPPLFMGRPLARLAATVIDTGLQPLPLAGSVLTQPLCGVSQI